MSVDFTGATFGDGVNFWDMFPGAQFNGLVTMPDGTEVASEEANKLANPDRVTVTVVYNQRNYIVDLTIPSEFCDVKSQLLFAVNSIMEQIEDNR